MLQQEIVPSAARTTSGNSAMVACGDGGNALCVGVRVTAASGTSPSMALTITWSHDGVNFSAGETVVSFAAITAAKQTTLRTTPQAPFYRLEWVLTGTSPSFTFSANAWSL